MRVSHHRLRMAATADLDRRSVSFRTSVQPVQATLAVFLTLLLAFPARAGSSSYQFRDPNSFGTTPITIKKIGTGATGSSPVLVLAIEFRDYRAPISIGRLDSLMNVDTLDPGTGKGGFRDYFVTNSYGQFVPNSHVHGWFEAERSYHFYLDTLDQLSACERLVEEGLRQADAAGVDFSLFDIDGDGSAETVVVFTSTLIKAHFGHLRGKPNFQEITFSPYTIQEPLLGVAAHEFGHALGLPDLYDGPSPFGYYDVMASADMGDGPGNLSAYSKILLGWIRPMEIGSPVSDLAVPNSYDHPFAITIRGQNGTDWGYFVIENRVQKGYDAGQAGTIAGSGLLIYHIHEYSRGWSHVEQADGREDLELYHSSGGWMGNRGDAGDFFPGTTHNTRFDAHSDPSSTTKAGTDTGVAITDISAPGDVMTVDVSFPVPTGSETADIPHSRLTLHPNYPNPFTISTRIGYELPGSGEIDLSVFDMAGRRVAVLASGRQVAGSHEAPFNAGTLPAGAYLVRLQAGDLLESRTVTLVR